MASGTRGHDGPGRESARLIMAESGSAIARCKNSIAKRARGHYITSKAIRVRRFTISIAEERIQP